MMVRSRRSKRLDPSQLRLPLIALIDVVLFLLMYFMVAGTMGGEERELSTAIGVERAGADGKRTALLPTILRIERDNDKLSYRLGQRIIHDKGPLTAMLKTLPKEAGIILKAGPGVTVGDVAAALQSCKDAEFVKISFVSDGK